MLTPEDFKRVSRIAAGYGMGRQKLGQLAKVHKVDAAQLMRQMSLAQAELNAMTMALRQAVEARGGTVEQVQDELIITEGPTSEPDSNPEA